jgi:hypothetical protein
MTCDKEKFLKILANWRSGYRQGLYKNLPYGVTVERSEDGKRLKLYARSLSDKDHVSFNLYYLKSGAKLKPCEMPEKKVVEFVIGFVPNK